MGAPARELRISVDLPWPSPAGPAPHPAALAEELRRLWLIEQVRTRRLGVGKAAELARMPRAAFMALLGQHGVPVIDYPAEDLEREIREADRG